MFTTLRGDHVESCANDDRLEVLRLALNAMLRGGGGVTDPVVWRKAANEVHHTTRRWRASPGIVGFAVGLREVAGDYTQDLAVKIYVDSKHTGARLGDARVPSRLHLPDFDAPIDLDVEPLPPFVIQSAADRPALGGDAISRVDGWQGTLGCLVHERGAPERRHILSNAHVLALTGRTAPREGDAIIAPGQNLADDSSARVIARLARWVRFSSGSGYPNPADAAIAHVEGHSVAPRLRDGLGTPTGVNESVQVGMVVKASGSASPGVRTGVVLAENFHLELAYPQPGATSVDYGFNGQVLCQGFTAKGDSGAVVLDRRNRVAGLHFAGVSEMAVSGRLVSRSVFTPIRTVLDRLDVDLVTDPGEPSPALADARLPLGFIPPYGRFPSAVNTLARTLWGEAEEEPREVLAAIAGVVANRAHAQRPNWGLTVEEVCRDHAQFSCWQPATERCRLTENVGPENAAFQRCLKLARSTLAGLTEDPCRDRRRTRPPLGATHYHADSVARPTWADGMTPCRQIGKYLFYRGVD